MKKQARKQLAALHHAVFMLIGLSHLDARAEEMPHWLCLLPVMSGKCRTPSLELVHGYGRFLRHLRFYYQFRSASL